jgi:sulfite reductase (ferredoxin)
MLKYKLPSTLDQDIDRFENDISAFLSGKLHETAFTAKRVKMGVYMERSYKTHMCRIRCAANIITPKQLGRIAKLAKKYGHPRVHITTRAEPQIHNVDIKNMALILRELKKINLSSRGGGGHTIRNIVTNHDSGICHDEVFDVQPHALCLTGSLIAEVDSFELPRKFKIGFSSTKEHSVNCILQDLGFVAGVNGNGKKGFEV